MAFVWENKMSEHRDDTTDGGAPSPTHSPLPSRHSYYDDDATGYEVYDPSKDDEDDEEETDGNGKP
jgi:hypothetical protein